MLELSAGYAIAPASNARANSLSPGADSPAIAPQRLQQLLSWLALKFGHPIHQGRLIQLRLTHQDIADAIGTTRVTVTRLMQDLERSGEIGYSPKKCIIVYESLAK